MLPGADWKSWSEKSKEKRFPSVSESPDSMHSCLYVAMHLKYSQSFTADSANARAQKAGKLLDPQSSSAFSFTKRRSKNENLSLIQKLLILEILGATLNY